MISQQNLHIGRHCILQSRPNWESFWSVLPIILQKTLLRYSSRRLRTSRLKISTENQASFHQLFFHCEKPILHIDSAVNSPSIWIPSKRNICFSESLQKVNPFWLESFHNWIPSNFCKKSFQKRTMKGLIFNYSFWRGLFRRDIFWRTIVTGNTFWQPIAVDFTNDKTLRTPRTPVSCILIRLFLPRER